MKVVKYKNPLYKGVPQFVPVVIKDRDCLIAVITQSYYTIENIEELMEENSIRKSTIKKLIGDICSSCINLDNTRFNGYAKDGLNLNKIDKKELKKLIEKHMEMLEVVNNSGENGEDILENPYFYINCACGNYISYKDPESIPNKNLNCDICDRVLIDYTGKHDYEFEYDEE